MKTSWYVILNPTSGNAKGLKHLKTLKKLFSKYDMQVFIVLSTYVEHEKKLAQTAIKQGYKKIISIGGDGTLHHIVNGIMSQNLVLSSKIQLGIIPTGTGNDWVKTYDIPKNMEKAIQIIAKQKYVLQDIGQIKLLSTPKIYYFNNVAGVGFDAFVVNKINALKKLGASAYLIGAFLSFFYYKKNKLHVIIGNNNIKSKIFMISIGLCKYSGGGLQLTDYKNHKNGVFDITLIKNITLFKIVTHLYKLYNGKIIHLKEVENYQTPIVKIKCNELTYIQADGELIGKGDVEIKIIREAIQFIIP